MQCLPKEASSARAPACGSPRSAHRLRRPVRTSGRARCDRELTDIFALQDQVIQRILAVLAPSGSPTAVTESVGHEGTRSVEAHDCLLRGLERFWLFSQQPVEEARAYFAPRSGASDPAYAAAHAWLARTLAFQWVMYWHARSGDPGAGVRPRQDGCRPGPAASLRTLRAVLGAELGAADGEEAIAAGLRAVKLDSGNADAHLFLSLALSASCARRGSVALHRKGMRLNPHPVHCLPARAGPVPMRARRLRGRRRSLRARVQLRDVFYPNHYCLCHLYALLGREEDAKAERDKLLELTGGRRPILRLMWLDEDLRRFSQELDRRVGL